MQTKIHCCQTYFILFNLTDTLYLYLPQQMDNCYFELSKLIQIIHSALSITHAHSHSQVSASQLNCIRRIVICCWDLKSMRNLLFYIFKLYYQYFMLENPLNGILPPDQADLILVMLISIPLSYILSFIYNKYLLLALTMTLTMGFQSILFPQQKWLLWGQQQIVYLLILLAPRKYVGHIIIAESFAALCAIQLRRLYMAYGVNSFDITGIFMMQLFNYIGMGYNYQNGIKDKNLLSNDQISRRIVERPSYITYLGYVNFLPACLVGPVYEYIDFEHYLNRTGDYANIPSTLPAIGKQLGIFLFSLVLYGATSIFPISTITQPEFLTYNFPYKLLYVVLCITHIQLKYVSAWSLGMASMRASGLTYNPLKNEKKQDGTVSEYNFGRVQVNNMWNFYMEPSIKVKADNWNISVQWALRRYIYQNMYNPREFTDDKKRKKRQSLAQLITALVSALWHGLYPGYYISFVHWIIYVQIAQQIYRVRNTVGSVLNKLYNKHQLIYNIVDNLFATFVLTYFGMAFHLMTWDRVWVYLSQTYLAPYITLYICFYVIVKMKPFHGKQKHHKKDGKIENAKTEQLQNKKE